MRPRDSSVAVRAPRSRPANANAQQQQTGRALAATLSLLFLASQIQSADASRTLDAPRALWAPAAGAAAAPVQQLEPLHHPGRRLRFRFSLGPAAFPDRDYPTARGGTPAPGSPVSEAQAQPQQQAQVQATTTTTSITGGISFSGGLPQPMFYVSSSTPSSSSPSSTPVSAASASAASPAERVARCFFSSAPGTDRCFLNPLFPLTYAPGDEARDAFARWAC
jgi:hypothetical protein